MATNLPPGPDLDHFVAAAMGKRAFADAHGHCLVEDHVGRTLWQPSTNRAQACGPVLDWLVNRVGLGIFNPGPIWPWNVCIENMNDPIGAMTLEHALCLAVVRVAEVPR